MKKMAAQSFSRRSIVHGGVIGAGLSSVLGASVSKASAQGTTKTFLLIPGAFVGGWYWRRVSDLLEKKGQKVFSPTLTGLGERSHLLSKDINLDTHVTDIVNVVKWENLRDICLVAHSYGGFPASGALEQIRDQVSSIVWVDAFKPDTGQRPLDFSAFAKQVSSAAEKGEVGIPAPKAAPVIVNSKDSDWLNSKATAHPMNTYLQAIKVSGALETVAKKTYIRTPRFPSPAFDKALAAGKADTTWNTLENTTSGHCVMIDEPDWLADQLLQAA